MRSILVLPLLLLLAGCGGPDAPAGEQTTGNDSPMRPVANVQELMLTVVEPAAEGYWDAVGWIIDRDGTQEIRPQNEEEWEAVRNYAYAVTESANLLMMEGRAADQGTWISLSQGMMSIGERAIEAALAKDPEAVFTVGGDLYESCTACHAAYALETLRPNFGGD